jgi:hypothetical protein
MVPVESATALDAERQGWELIEHALARVALVTRYTLSVTPSGAVRPFNHEQLNEQIRAIQIVAVHAFGSSRKWLREPQLTRDPIEHGDAALKTLKPALAAIDPRLDLAVAAWRRATLARDAPTVVVALAEALEFYVAGTVVAGLFSVEERRRLDEAIGFDWTPQQRQRLDWLLGVLNDASFAVRLATALGVDAVALTPEEQALLRTTREMRNDILHGRGRPPLAPDDVRRALALVGRILTTRAHRLATSQV